MADNLPINFPIPAESAIATYDWQEINSGTGYVTLYPAGVKNSAGTTYILSSELIDGGFDTYIIVNGATAETDFDLYFNLPAIIAGTALIEYSVETAVGTTITPTFTFYKVVGVTETSIGSVVGPTTPASTVRREAAQCSLTKTSFAATDKLRVSISITTVGGNGIFYIDPKSRVTHTETGTSATISSNCIINVPFRIDL